jgi:hypothetical protein
MGYFMLSYGLLYPQQMLRSKCKITLSLGDWIFGMKVAQGSDWLS